MTVPVLSKEFWQGRIEQAIKRGELHRAIYDMDIATWKLANEVHQKIIANLLAPYRCAKVLDGGCGFGALVSLLPEQCQYTGVDFSPDLLKVARQLHPEREFIEADLRDLPFKKRHFDIAICRSVDGMIRQEVGIKIWRQMEKELLRVADRLVLLNFSQPSHVHVIE